MEDRFAADIMDFERTHQMWSFLRQKYELLTSLPTLLLFIMSSFFARVMLQLRISLISFLLLGASLTLLVVSCPLPHVHPAEIRQLHLSFI
jgi:hypothetical protein